MFYFNGENTLPPRTFQLLSRGKALLFLQVLSSLVNGMEKTACTGLCCLNIQYIRCLVSAAFAMQNFTCCLAVNVFVLLFLNPIFWREIFSQWLNTQLWHDLPVPQSRSLEKVLENQIQSEKSRIIPLCATLMADQLIYNDTLFFSFTFSLLCSSS